MKIENYDYIKSKLVNTEDPVAIAEYELKWREACFFPSPPARPDTISMINNYVLKGYDPGSFLVSVLSNNLSSTFAHADDDNRRRVFAVVSYLHCHVPASCHGSYSAVCEWMNQFKKKEKDNDPV